LENSGFIYARKLREHLVHPNVGKGARDCLLYRLPTPIDSA
jgi:hypothetical protein